MANLIPPQAKRNIMIEYWVRVVSVWLGLLGTAALTIAALNVPVYILIQNQLQTYNSVYEEASAQKTSFEKIEADIVLANNTAVLLATARNVHPLVMFIEEIERIASEAVDINNFILKRKGNTLESIQVSGVATNRETLLRFSDDMEAHDAFLSAEIPLSNLAKDSNIPFTVNVIVDQTKTP